MKDSIMRIARVGSFALLAWVCLLSPSFAQAETKPVRLVSHIRVISPNGGETLKTGSLYQLKWTVTPMANGRFPDTFNVWLIDRTTHQKKEIISDVATEFGIGWQVEGLPLDPHADPRQKNAKDRWRDRYVIRIECFYADQCIGDRSDKPFAIEP